MLKLSSVLSHGLYFKHVSVVSDHKHLDRRKNLLQLVQGQQLISRSPYLPHWVSVSNFSQVDRGLF